MSSAIGRAGLLAASLGFLSLLGGQPSQAGSFRVELQDGRRMTAQAVTVRPNVVVLQLRASSRLVVSRSMISNWSELIGAVHAARDARASRWRQDAGHYGPLVERYARKHDLSPALLSALAEVESGFNPRAVSFKGALGLVQLMPATAERFGVRYPFDPADNLDGGARYLKWLLERYGGTLESALAAYNAGEAAVDRYDGIPPYAETREFVRRVLKRLDEYAGP